MFVLRTSELQRAANSVSPGAGKPSPFVLDARAVGLFRVLLAVLILIDQGMGLGDWHAHYSEAGILSPADARQWLGPWYWSLYWLGEGPVVPIALEAVRLAATLTLLVGIRSRLSAAVLFLVLASFAVRNPLVVNGGDRVLIVMTFFGAFLPLGGAWSLERLWHGGETARTVRSAGTTAYVVQVLLVWFMAGIHKTAAEWWGDGTALSMALHLEAFVAELARLWRGYDAFVQPLTFFVFWLECLAPLLALVPVYACRVVGLGALIALEVGIWASIEVGIFPLISLVSLAPLTPVPIVAALSGWWCRSLRSAPSSLRLFYDGECSFCLFACRLVVAVAGLRDAVVAPAVTDPVARRILEENGSWSVAPLGASPGEYRHGWDAVRLALARSPRPWLVRLVPGSREGERLYGLIAKHRNALGLAGAVCFGRGRGIAGHGPAGAVFVSFALAAVLAWNVVTYPAVREWWDLRHVVRPVVATFGLTQYWTMFAPRPYSSDAWHLVPGLGRDRQVVELLSGEELRVHPPVDGPRHYGGVRWRTAVFRSIKRREVGRLLRYWCRTGPWDAVELWEFRRANLGVAATAALPYEASRLAFWECGDADLERVEAFSDDVARRMEAYTSSVRASGRASTSVP